MNLSKVDTTLIVFAVLGVGAIIMPSPNKLTRNFSRSEFDSKDGQKVPLLLYPNLQRLAVELQKIRDVVGRVVVTSGWRSKQHNENVGGASGSYHLLAMAGDISAPDYAGGDERALHSLILKMIADKRLHNGGVGLYVRAGTAGWVHYDVRRNAARWNG